MLSLDGVESIGVVSAWMLEPDLGALLLGLRERGYATARVRPRSAGGYEIMFLEPGVIAIKGLTYILYNPERRILAVEGSRAEDVLATLNEVEEILRGVGSKPERGVLFYELQAKAKASGGRAALKKTVETEDLLGFNLLAVPTSLVSADGNPNSTQWFHLEVRPLWSSWPDERVRYEVILVYRDRKDKLMETLKRLGDLLKEILNRINTVLEK
ncbi:MAG: hypothetical protein OWQ51_11390 [Pyrobaculum arsenaticum]|uniref:Uncharacterized protein n=2 Tax=Pyrobaculum arsenaticum TaxID=121277 RepID=A4WHS1_PYRAR|nr:hypothetical protein [Pyrobaculum arsenaticum]ABP49938.1 conserved hypothetical protein [Pyrobaculum arsenaticum DSM 13514]MCY0891549.1 hypothetical protein [Pyrobaculum arsenaticum]NYR15926.1 hypothetical protein [Pyrobaculum arsenaticum]